MPKSLESLPYTKHYKFVHCSLLSFLTSCFHVPCPSLQKFISMSYKLHPHCLMTTPFWTIMFTFNTCLFLNNVWQTIDIDSCLLSSCSNAPIIIRPCPYILSYLQHPLLYINHNHLYPDILSYYHTSIIVICKELNGNHMKIFFWCRFWGEIHKQMN